MLPHWEMITRLLAAAALGSIIGFERERLSWAAGLRTHMLVCVGACLIMIVSAFGFADILGTPNVQLDPSRVAAQVVSGIGFLGAGSILLRGEVIRGLTTAASLWSVAGIGLATGGGLYVAAVSATIIIYIILAGLKPLEERYRLRRQSAEIRVSATHGTLSLQTLNEALGARVSKVRQFIVQQSEVAEFDEITITLSPILPKQTHSIIEELKLIPTVRDVHEV